MRKEIRARKKANRESGQVGEPNFKTMFQGYLPKPVDYRALDPDASFGSGRDDDEYQFPQHLF